MTNLSPESSKPELSQRETKLRELRSTLSLARVQQYKRRTSALGKVFRTYH